MLKKLNDFLSGLPMTIVAGAFLLLDLVPHLMEEFGGDPVQLAFLPFDPCVGNYRYQRSPAFVSGSMEDYS